MKKSFIIVFLIIVSFILVFPIIFTVSNSFMSNGEISAVYKNIFNTMSTESENTKFVLFPRLISFNQYYNVIFKNLDYFNGFWNSCIFVIPSVTGSAVISLILAYGFSKFHFRFKELIFYTCIITMLLPYQVLMIPQYIIMDKAGLAGGILSIIIIMLFSPLGVVFLRFFIDKIPNEFIESARVDGANEYIILFKIVVPMCVPAIGTYILIYAIELWSMIEYPIVFLDSEYSYPLALSLSSISKESIGSAFACSVIFTAPIVLVFIIFKDYFIDIIKR